jgi:hypothetical protein
LLFYYIFTSQVISFQQQQGPCIDWLSGRELWGGHFIDRIESAEFNEEFKRQQQQGPYDSIECHPTSGTLAVQI